MAATKNRALALVLTMALFGLNLVALNYLIGGWSGARLDLTEENVFSISPATKRILASLDEDLTIRGYFSKRTHPKLAPLIPEITDLLNEYRAVYRLGLRDEAWKIVALEVADQKRLNPRTMRGIGFYRCRAEVDGAVVAEAEMMCSSQERDS